MSVFFFSIKNLFRSRLSSLRCRDLKAATKTSNQSLLTDDSRCLDKTNKGEERLTVIDDFTQARCKSLQVDFHAVTKWMEIVSCQKERKLISISYHGVLWIMESTNVKYFIGKPKKHWYDPSGYTIPQQQEHLIYGFSFCPCTKQKAEIWTASLPMKLYPCMVIVVFTDSHYWL